MPHIYTDYYKKNYGANWNSVSAIWWYIVFLVAIVFTFFLCYYTNGFYLKVEYYFEQPTVTFTQNFAIEVVQVSASGETTDSIFTTYSRYTDYNYNTLPPPYFSYYTVDDLNDGTNEKIVFDITLQGVASDTIRNLYLAMSFNYGLSSIVNSQMISLAYFDIQAPNGLGKVQAYGSLKLVQNDAIDNSFSKQIGYNIDQLAKVSNASLTQMYSDYTSRQYYTEFEGNIAVLPYGGATEVDIRVELLIPKGQEIYYNPNLFESLKTAWIQYVYVFIAVYYILIYHVLRLAYSSQIVQAHIYNDLPKEKDKKWYQRFEGISTIKN